MIKDVYRKKITEIIAPFIRGGKVRVFIFGSSARKDRFGDCDIGLLGEINEKKVREIKEAFEMSTLPYKVDVVNFNMVSQNFKENVFSQPLVWIQP